MHIYPNNTIFRIGVILREPASSSCFLKPICPDRGYGVDAALLVCQFLRLNCTFHILEGSEKVQNWTGMLMQAILDDRFDTSLPVFMPSYRRMNSLHLHFSHAYFYGDAVLITRAVDRGNDFDFSVLRSFQWPLWCAFAFSYLALRFVQSVEIVIGRLMIGAEKRKNRYWISVERLDRKCGWHRLCRRTNLLSCLFLQFMLNSSYTGVQYSKNVSSRTRVPFHNVDTFISCVYNRKCLLIASEASASLNWLLNQTSVNPPRRLSDALGKNPIKYYPRDDVIAEIRRDRQSYVSTIMPRDAFNDLTNHNQDCVYHVIRVPYLDMNTFPMKEKWKYRRDFDLTARYFQEFGLAAVLERKYRLNGDKCGDLTRNESGSPVLIVQAIYSVYAFYAAGAGAALSVFVMEFFLFRIMDEKFYYL